jgi:hypothetical protein
MVAATFVGANGTALTAHDANWAIPTGATGLQIRANTAVAFVDGVSSVNYWNATFADAHYSKSVLSASVEATTGCAIRIQSGEVSYFWAHYVASSTLVTAGEWVAGVSTQWESGISGFAPGDTIELAIDETVSTTVYLKANGATIRTFTGKNALSGGRPGVHGRNQSFNGIVSWEGGDVAVTPPIEDQPETLHVIRSGIRLS